MKRVHWAVILSGFVAVIAQTQIIREGFVLFGGNELISGILLFQWLIWVGIGSLIFTHLRLKYRPQVAYSSQLIILSLLLVFAMVFIRLSPRIFALRTGEIIPLDKTIFILLVCLTPTCIVLGGLFPIGVRILGPTKVYLCEAIGSCLGGLALSFLLIELMSPLGILILVVAFMWIMAIVLIDRPKLLFFPFLLLLIFARIGKIELALRRVQMGGQEIVAMKESRYGLIAVTSHSGQLNFYTNGVYDFTYPDEYSSEEAVHYSMLLHRSPKKVLLVGGGLAGGIDQVFKHPGVDELTYLELDPLLFELGERSIGKSLGGDKRLHVVFGDARFYIKHTRERYDVVIINLPDPTNAQLNRFYTNEFFAEAKRLLAPDGLLSIAISAPPDIIGPLYGQLLNTIYRSLSVSFGKILILPAARVNFIATDWILEPTDIIKQLKRSIAERNLTLKYVNAYYFDYNLRTERLDYLSTRIAESPGVLNTDLRPACYYFTTTLWGWIVSERMKGIFIALFRLNPIFFFLLLIIAFIFYGRRSIVYLSVFSVGTSLIASEIILLILFQVFYGFLYGWIGLIIAFFMLGLALGAIVYLKTSLARGNLIKILSNIDLFLALCFLVIILIAMARWSGTYLLIPVMVLIGGFLGGLHFPVSVALLKQERAGLVYGIDLIGAGLSALVTSLILIPILGIIPTLLIFLLLNLLVGIGLRTARLLPG